MKILLAHNFYQQPGGEDQVFASEASLLESFGHEVVRYSVHNDSVNAMGRLALARATHWNNQSHIEIAQLVRTHRPDVVHFHNTFPLISPAAYYAARQEGAAVVQTLHNFRLLCPGALFLRDGKPCEDCLGKSIAWPAIKHGCYRQSRSATAVIASTVAFHRALGTWDSAIDAYIALSQFSRQRFVAGGLPARKIIVKPNFVHPDPGPGHGAGGYAIFVGRLSPEKGLHTLLRAWQTLRTRIPLKIIGDGPLVDDVKAAVAQGGVEWLGRKTPDEVCDIVGNASFLVFPSECYETFGRVAIEAFAKGTPVLASNHGSMAALVNPGQTGLLFQPGDAADLIAKANDLLDNPHRLAQMRTMARTQFEAAYTGPQNHQQLLRIYQIALNNASTSTCPPVSRPRVSLPMLQTS